MGETKDTSVWAVRDRVRIRRIVKLAAKESTSARAWLTNDEFGTWEKTAGEYLDKALANPLSKTMTDEAIDAEVAGMLAFLALEALLRDARGR